MEVRDKDNIIVDRQLARSCRHAVVPVDELIALARLCGDDSGGAFLVTACAEECTAVRRVGNQRHCIVRLLLHRRCAHSAEDSHEDGVLRHDKRARVIGVAVVPLYELIALVRHSRYLDSSAFLIGTSSNDRSHCVVVSNERDGVGGLGRRCHLCLFEGRSERRIRAENDRARVLGIAVVPLYELITGLRYRNYLHSCAFVVRAASCDGAFALIGRNYSQSILRRRRRCHGRFLEISVESDALGCRESTYRLRVVYLAVAVVIPADELVALIRGSGDLHRLAGLVETHSGYNAHRSVIDEYQYAVLHLILESSREGGVRSHDEGARSGRHAVRPADELIAGIGNSVEVQLLAIVKIARFGTLYLAAEGRIQRHPVLVRHRAFLVIHYEMEWEERHLA